MFKLPCSYTIYKGKAKKLNKQQTQTIFYYTNLHSQIQIDTNKNMNVNQYHFDLHIQIHKQKCTLSIILFIIS